MSRVNNFGHETYITLFSFLYCRSLLFLLHLLFPFRSFISILDKLISLPVRACDMCI